MLPPSLSTLAMDDILNKTQESLTLQQQQQQQQQAHIQQHQPSDFYLNSSINNDISAASSSSSTLTNFFPTVPFNTSSIKHFFNKTLAKVAQTNFSDYTSSPASSSTNFSIANSTLNTGAELYAGLIAAETTTGGSSDEGIVEVSNGFDSYAVAADIAVSSLSNGSHHLETTTAFPTVQTVATTFMAGNKNRASTIIVYPTVSPESVVIPIVSCIFGFPILAFIVICCLRHRAKLARERDRRRNYDMQDHAVSLVRFSPIHRLNYRTSRAISLRPDRSLSQGFNSLELDTVVEERCSDVEQTQTEILNPESPMESSTTSYKISFSSS